MDQIRLSGRDHSPGQAVVGAQCWPGMCSLRGLYVAGSRSGAMWDWFCLKNTLLQAIRAGINGKYFVSGQNIYGLAEV